jgi:hypothetical protein
MLFEPLSTLFIDLGMFAVVGKLEQALDGLPNREIDQYVVAENGTFIGWCWLRYETRFFMCQAVNLINSGNETCHDRMIEGRKHLGDIRMDKVVGCFGHS